MGRLHLDGSFVPLAGWYVICSQMRTFQAQNSRLLPSPSRHQFGSACANLELILAVSKIRSFKYITPSGDLQSCFTAHVKARPGELILSRGRSSFPETGQVMTMRTPSRSARRHVTCSTKVLDTHSWLQSCKNKP